MTYPSKFFEKFTLCASLQHIRLWSIIYWRNNIWVISELAHIIKFMIRLMESFRIYWIVEQYIKVAPEINLCLSKEENKCTYVMNNDKVTWAIVSLFVDNNRWISYNWRYNWTHSVNTAFAVLRFTNLERITVLKSYQFARKNRWRTFWTRPLKKYILFHVSCVCYAGNLEF